MNPHIFYKINGPFQGERGVSFVWRLKHRLDKETKPRATIEKLLRHARPHALRVCAVKTVRFSAQYLIKLCCYSN